jgi:F-type H+-transporting ATPase subunit gamma
MRGSRSSTTAAPRSTQRSDPEVETPEALRRRMEIAGTLRDLVRTMKTLAAVSVHRYEHAVVALNEYRDTVELGLRAALRDAVPAPPRPPRADARHGLIVFGSDQGLCGTFNEQVVTRLREDLAAGGPDGGRVRLYAVGGRVAGRLVEAGLTPEGEASLPLSTSLLPTLVQELLLLIDGWRSDGDLRGVSLYHNRPVGNSAIQPHRTVLLPITAERLQALHDEPWPTRALPMLGTDRAALLGALTRQFLFVTVHRALAFSLMAEHTSRLLAMQAAERNIDERLDELTSRYHTERQTAITAELLDIVSGAEALVDGAT